MKLSELERKSVANACYAMASGNFADMINRQNRGRAFCWSEFPDDVAERCEYEIIIYLDMNEWPDEKVDMAKRIAKDFGHEISSRLVRRAGLCE